MPTQPIFANEYYKDRYLFANGWQIDKTPSGKPKKLSAGFFTQFYRARYLQPNLTDQGTLVTAASSFFEDFTKQYSLSQNQDQITAHLRLKALEAELQNPSSSQLQTFKEEIHSMKWEGANCLAENLHALNTEFEKSNQKSIFTLTLVKIINCVKAIFNWQPIEFYHFTPLDLNAFKEKAITPALELTDQDRLRSKYFPIIENHSPFPLPPELTRENLQKLELGLMNQISFIIDHKSFSVKFDQTRGEFALHYCGSDNDYLEPLSGESISLSTPGVTIRERKPDGSTTNHPLRLFLRTSYDSGPGFQERWKFSVKGEYVFMTTNNEYTIPLSQGSLTFKPFRRI